MLSDQELVDQDPSIIRNIANPTEELQMIAVRRDPQAIQYIWGPTRDTLILAIRSDLTTLRHMPWVPDDLLNGICRVTPEALGYMEKMTLQTQERIVWREPTLIQYIKKPYIKVQLWMTAKSLDLFRLIQDPAEEAKELAAKTYDGALQYIKDPSLKVQVAAYIRLGILDYQRWRPHTPEFHFELASYAYKSRELHQLHHLDSMSDETMIKIIDEIHPSLVSHFPSPTPAVEVAALRYQLDYYRCFVSGVGETKSAEMKASLLSKFIHL